MKVVSKGSSAYIGYPPARYESLLYITIGSKRWVFEITDEEWGLPTSVLFALAETIAALEA